MLQESSSLVRLPLFYLPPVSWWKVLLHDPAAAVLEQWENLPRQTYRNRCCIYGANGKLVLSIPVKSNKTRKYKDAEISFAEDWIKDHWKSIKMAYQSSPYFEYYEDRLQEIFTSPETKLFDFNLKALTILSECMQLKINFSLSDSYFLDGQQDRRESFPAKAAPEEFPPYTQVFGEKFGFISDLSIIDLLCAEGPNAVSYIKNLIK